ncbi:ABC transporter permease [Fodinisporobacter ferrooxydans]|uniref:Autoinducer 2 import system permease protein LsrD n=1 Tax=Fodinisporobacter ferrooxydans TaxID=2901836 RepID=A0ABY4CQH3_9BACL|nr:ABC transporter permease [Alicyclobacillaceae bacterium MYW30-H2]
MLPVVTESRLLSPWKKIRASVVLKVYLTAIALYIVSGLMERNYFTLQHLMDTLVLASFLGIVAMGQTLVILTGGIDLSISYVLNFGAVMMTQMTTEHGGIAAAVIVCLTGLVIGVLNGIGVAYFNISPLIMTLGMNSVVKGLSLIYTNGTPKGSAPHWLRFLGTGSILGIRTAILVWILLTLAVVVLLMKTTFGRRIYALGNNPYTSYLSGVNNKRITISVYALSSLFAVLAGMMMTGFSGLSYLGMGDMLLLPSVAAVVIGGTSILGGMGGYLGTFAGAVIIYILQSILTIVHMQDAGRQILYGLVILVVLFLYGRDSKRN